MKSNHLSLIKHIRQALQYCGEDAVLSETKRLLTHALRETERVGKKRDTRAATTKRYEEEAKKKNEQWWDVLKKNVGPFPQESSDQGIF